MEYGYSFVIYKGYQFAKGNIFKEYVLKMYELRMKYPKSDPMNYIAKLLMNSLYGKFGMKLETTEVFMYDTTNESQLQSFHKDIKFYGESVTDFIIIDNHLLVTRNKQMYYKYNEELDMYHGQDVNIAIASAITSCARVHMSYFKNNPLFNLFYSDTDSAVIDALLPEFMVGDQLGQLKLEHIINKAVFLAPKVYGLVTEDGQKIIKVKGIRNPASHDINFNSLVSLLIQDSSKEITQEK